MSGADVGECLLPATEPMRALLLPTLVLLLLARALPAAEYHVDPAGDDARDGATPATAWATTAKVAATRFAPGDAILFKRGGTWRGSLTASSSGAEGRPITCAAYGTGAKPVLLGSELLDNARFVPRGGPRYEYAIATPVRAALADRTFLVEAGRLPAGRTMDTWTWRDGVLSIAVTGRDPRSDGRAYAVCLREDAIASDGRDHLVFRDLATGETARADGGYGVRIMGSRDVLVERCEAYRAGKHHFACINSTAVVFRSCRVAWAMPGQGAGGATAYVSFGDGSTGLADQTSSYIDCSFDHAEDAAGGGADRYAAFTTHGPNIGAVLLDGFASRGGGLDLGNSDNLRARIRVHGGLVDDARVEVHGTGIRIDGLRITGARGTIDVNGEDTVLQNLVISGTDLGSAWYQSAIVDRGLRTTLRFSTVVLGATAPDSNTCVAIVDRSRDLRCYGNILWSNGRVVKRWSASPVLGAWGCTLYRSGARFDDLPFRLAARGQRCGIPRSAGRGLRQRPAEDYRLRADSPAVDAGAALGRDPVDPVARDAFDAPRLQGAAVDLGACERTPGAPEAR